ncbi:prepilin peptidase [candidate division KSB1 bacterium]
MERMDQLIIFFVFLFGLSIGSFLNVCIYRIPRKKSLISPPSFCINCDSKIKFRDNIPVLSYLLLNGKCRNCKEKISRRYPLVELFSGLLTLLIYVKFGNSIDSLIAVLLIYISLIIIYIDLEFLIIPNSLIIIGIAFIFIIQAVFHHYAWLDFLIAGLIGGGFLIFTAALGKILFRKNSLGIGDIKYGVLLGLFLGIQNIVVGLSAAFVIAALISGGGSILSGKKPVGKIPFGPFLSIGAMVSIFFGNEISEIYINWVGL